MTITDYSAYKVTRLLIYLNELKKEAISINGSEEVVNLATKYFWKLFDYFNFNNETLEVPDACPGLRDNFVYTWSKSEHYLECEIFGSGEIEFFYRNRNTGEVWGEDYHINDHGFPDSVYDEILLDKLSYFVE